jgi:hypothetical protein
MLSPTARNYSRRIKATYSVDILTPSSLQSISILCVWYQNCLDVGQTSCPVVLSAVLLRFCGGGFTSSATVAVLLLLKVTKTIAPVIQSVWPSSHGGGGRITHSPLSIHRTQPNTCSLAATRPHMGSSLWYYIRIYADFYSILVLICLS